MTAGSAADVNSSRPPERAFELLLEVLERPPAERVAFLARAAGDDSELRRQVEELLALEGDAEDFLPRSRLTLDETSPGLEAGTRIGPYRISGRLGSGGMGSVYRAVREDDFTKPVAIKLIHSHLVNEATVRRFHAERQILAGLEHPGIARLLDGGTTGDGRPYLVMELIEGEPIDQYCRRHQLVATERLELFLPVLDALAYAHRNLVVHRDLKPGNVLVTTGGVTAEGAPKLVDFGIAKLLDAEGAPALTLLGERPMTPRYSSPEQVRGEAVTTASDVYSAGVLLYQLLTGRLPGGLDDCGAWEIPQRICEEPAAKPSTAVRRAASAPAGDASPPNPRDDPRKLRRRLTGDVDAILLKALRKRPEQRYPSVDELAEDIRRHLEGRPVAARRGTWTYRVTRFVRRRRWGLAAAAVLVLVIATAIGLEWRRLRSEHQRARRFASALEQLVTLADPDAETLSAGGLLASARAQLADLEGEPELQVELLDSLGRIHRKRGNFEEARELLAESLAIWRRARPGDHLRLALRLNNLASLDLDLGDRTAAEARYREALRMVERLGGPESEELAVHSSNLATVLMYRGAFDEAETLYRRGLAIRQRQHGGDDPRVAASLRGLGALLHARGAPEEAEPLLRRALTLRLAAHGPEHTAVASVLDLLGRVRLAAGEKLEAERLLARALEIRRRRLGPEHPSVARSERNLAALLLAEGELATARLLLVHALASLEQARATDDWRIADVESVLGELLLAEGRLAEAEPCLTGSARRLLLTRGGTVYARDAQLRVARLHEALELTTSAAGP